MNSTKKLMTLLLALMLPVSIFALPPTDYDNYEFEVDGIYYKIEGSVACVTFQRYASGMHLSDYHGDVVIPSSVTYQGKTYPVKTIDFYAFNYCQGLTSITIPESITSIRSSAFYLCTGLTRVTIKDITAWCNAYIDSNPLLYAQHLYLNDTEVTDLTIPDGITAIHDNAFQGCSSLLNVTIPNSVKTIGNHAFEDCAGLTSIDIPNSVTQIGELAFECCTSLTSVSLGNSVAIIWSSAFEGCTRLASIDIPNSVTDIGGNAFSGCSTLSSVSIGNSVRTINGGAFKGCAGLTSIEIPNSVMTIGGLAFKDCSGLTSVSIGKSVSSIGQEAFMNCTLIEKVTCLATTPPAWFGLNMFTTNVYNHAPLHVPTGCERTYMSHEGWGQFLTIIGDADVEEPSDDVAGDVNGDGEVNIADVNAIIGVILGANSNPRADVNGDGEVNIADVNAIIDIILGGSAPHPSDIETITVNGVSFHMVKVEGGTFTMGATPEQGSYALDWEYPTHQVTLSSYSIGETEVTQALWEAVMGNNPSYNKGNNKPVEMVTWNDCQEFITKLNQMTGKSFRLPTEAEWEYAARGGNKSQGYRYAGSNNIDEVAWYLNNIPAQSSDAENYGPQIVATKAPNELGIYDMSGNVNEWCHDWFGDYSSNAQTNPIGPDAGSERVLRGGYWHYKADYCRVSYRNYAYPWEKDGSTGLRLVLNPDVDVAEGHEYIDLGLPSGTLWATCNIGANAPEEYGDYFAWGETEPKDDYNWNTNKWGYYDENSKLHITKYNTNSGYGPVDNKIELDTEDDAAYVNWGPSWRMPTMVQIKELINKCFWEWTTRNGMNGYRVIGPNGNELFLPATGYHYNSSLYYSYFEGHYWSRDLYDIHPDGAYRLRIAQGARNCNVYNRYFGYAIRAVRVSQ